MTSPSPYAVTSSLTVACPARPEGCGAAIGEWCVRPTIGPSGIVGYERRLRCHSARRRLADEQRTREVNPDLDPPSYLPMREQPPPRIPDLCPDDEYSGRYATAKDLGEYITILLTPAQIALINEQQRKAEALVRNAIIDGYPVIVAPIDAKHVGVTLPEPHNPETCRDPACDCFPF